MSTSDLPFVPWESLSPAEKITALEIALRQAQQQLAENNDDEPTTYLPWSFEVCGDCGRNNIAAFRVSDAMWDRVVGEDGVLCLWCFDQRAAVKGVDWCEEPIEFHPVSTVQNHKWGAQEVYKPEPRTDNIERNDDEPTTSHLLAHGQNRNQYTGSEPTTPKPQQQLEFTRDEISFLFGLVNERILEADKAGIERSHSSSVFRQQLWDKLLDYRRWADEHQLST